MKITITDAELPVMKVIWEKGASTAPEIFSNLKGNTNTLKTLLLRLVQKNAVRVEEINSRRYRYHAMVTEKEYVNNASQSFLQKFFDGSAKKMLLNFVKEENISTDDLRELVSMIEEDAQ